MKKREPPPEAKPQPKPIAQKRSVENRLGEILREVAREDNPDIRGEWGALAERAQEHWVKRAASVIQRAAQRKIVITDQNDV